MVELEKKNNGLNRENLYKTELSTDSYLLIFMFMGISHE